MRILFIGDVVGRPGRKALKDNLKGLKVEFHPELVIANGENAAGGNGITKDTAKDLINCGVDIITMGNHVWDKKDVLKFISNSEHIIRPANYPPGTPGQGYKILKIDNDLEVAVINLSGRVFMDALDCPFRKADDLLMQIKEMHDRIRVIFIDFHAEATSEKKAMGYYLDGRVSAVCGTHTHVQTADECILPGGTAYITDVGMTGPSNSVIGVDIDIILRKFTTQIPERFEVAKGFYQLNAVIIDIDEVTGKATNINRIQNFE